MTVSKIGLAGKASLITAVVLAAIAIVFTLVQIVLARQEAKQQVASEMATRIGVLANATAIGLEGSRLEKAADGSILRIRTPVFPPKEGDHRIVDHAIENATLAVYEPATGDFLRTSSSVRDADGKRLMIGTRIPAGSDIATAASRGEPVEFVTQVAGEARVSRYVPIVGMDGKALGVIGTGMTVASIEARQWQQTLMIMVYFGLFGLVVGSATFILLTAMLKPIGKISAAIDGLAQNRKPIVDQYLRRGDEIGLIAKSIGALYLGLQEAERLRGEQTSREETERQTLSRREKLANDFVGRMQALAGSFIQSSAEVADSAKNLSATAEETSRQAQAVAAAAEEAASNVQTVSAASEELAASVREIGSQVSHSARIADTAFLEAETSNVRIGALATAASAIGDVVNLIRDIAGQTNLLALNATIEAARAGEAGKGFAVVAAEVKQLADQTSKATGDIGAKVQEIQKATGESVTSMSEIVRVVGDIKQISSAIASAVEEQSVSTAEIARNCQQAATGTHQVTENISGVGQAAEMTGSASTQLMTLSTGLSGQAVDLRKEVEGFVKDFAAA
ncbi:MAG: methyl-accepting chemotaxis protein [Ancalomicrobiaceae bacterium]|nr:methyl-accepting chemotaxis protein [Ancalomicrobiaceae bacterium]